MGAEETSTLLSSVETSFVGRRARKHESFELVGGG